MENNETNTLQRTFIITRKLYNSIYLTYLVLFTLIIPIFLIFSSIISSRSAISTHLSKNTFTDYKIWFLFLIYLCVIFIHNIVTARNNPLLKATSQNRIHLKPTNRFRIITQVYLSKENIILLLTHCISAIILTILSGVLLDVRPFAITENIQYGIWLGLFYHYEKSRSRLTFPVLVNQRKLTQFRSALPLLLTDSVRFGFSASLVFSVCAGFLFSAVFTGRTQLFDDENTTVYTLFCHQLWVGGFYVFTNTTIVFLLNLCVTEPVQFGFETGCGFEVFEKDVAPDLVLWLACVDLLRFSKAPTQCRCVLFSLSQPGGHPHVWNKLASGLEKCLKGSTEVLTLLIENFIEVRRLKYKNPPKFSCFESKRSVQANFRNLRHVDEDVPIQYSGENEPFDHKNRFFDSLLSTIRRMTGFAFFFDPLPDVDINNWLEGATYLTWLSQSLAQILTVSLNEDTYGVVQKDVASLLCALVQLKRQLDRLKTSDLKLSWRASKQRFLIHEAVLRSVYMVYKNFEAHLRELHVPKDVVTYLETLRVIKNP